MPEIQQSLEALIAVKEDPDKAYVSGYFHKLPPNKYHYQQLIKSTMLSAMREYEPIKDKVDWHHNLIDVINTLIDQQDKLATSIAVFFTFEYTSDSWLLPKLEDVHIIKLDEEVENSVYINNNFNLLPLLKIESKKNDALIVGISAKTCIVKEYKDGEFKDIDRFDTIYTTHEDRSKYSTSSTGTGKVFFRTGEDPNQIAELNRKFLGQIYEKLKEKGYSKERAHNLIVTVSSAFRDFKDYIEKHFDDFTTGALIVSLQDNIDQPDLAQKAIEELQATNQEHLKERLEEVIDNYYLFSDEVEEIKQAAKEGRVRTIFLKEPSEQYSLNSVSEIIPTINTALKTDAEVLFLNQRTFKKFPDIAAEFRF